MVASWEVFRFVQLVCFPSSGDWWTCSEQFNIFQGFEQWLEILPWISPTFPTLYAMYVTSSDPESATLGGYKNTQMQPTSCTGTKLVSLLTVVSTGSSGRAARTMGTFFALLPMAWTKASLACPDGQKGEHLKGWRTLRAQLVNSILS